MRNPHTTTSSPWFCKHLPSAGCAQAWTALANPGSWDPGISTRPAPSISKTLRWSAHPGNPYCLKTRRKMRGAEKSPCVKCASTSEQNFPRTSRWIQPSVGRQPSQMALLFWKQSNSSTPEWVLNPTECCIRQTKSIFPSSVSADIEEPGKTRHINALHAPRQWW